MLSLLRQVIIVCLAQQCCIKVKFQSQFEGKVFIIFIECTWYGVDVPCKYTLDWKGCSMAKQRHYERTLNIEIIADNEELRNKTREMSDSNDASKFRK